MPSVTRDEAPLITSTASKKRRRDDDNTYSSFSANAAIHDVTIFDDHNHSHLDRSFDVAGNHTGAGPGPGIATRKILPLTSASKKQRMTAALDVKDRVVRSPAATTRPAPPPMTASQYKRNQCHICGRRPLVLADLDAYADCQGCGNRTCYVCIRQCLGWVDESIARSKKEGEAHAHDKVMHDGVPDGVPDENQEGKVEHQPEREGALHENIMHDLPSANGGQPSRSTGTNGPIHAARHAPQSVCWNGHCEVICSRCCIEKGADGEVVCLGCLPYV